MVKDDLSHQLGGIRAMDPIMDRPRSHSRKSERTKGEFGERKESIVERRDDGPLDESPPSDTSGLEVSAEPRIGALIVLEGQAFRCEDVAGLNGTVWLERHGIPNFSTTTRLIEKQHVSSDRHFFTQSFEITVGDKLLCGWENRSIRSHSIEGRSVFEFAAKRDDDVKFVAMQLMRSERARVAIKIIWRDGDVAVISFDVNNEGVSIETDRHPWYRLLRRLDPICAGSLLDALYHPTCWSYPLVYSRKTFDWYKPQSVNDVETTRPWVWFQDRCNKWYRDIERAKERSSLSLV